MCGIFGFVGQSDLHFVGKRMLSHRGPDDYGALMWDGVAPPRLFQEPFGTQWRGAPRVLFEHMRLSVLDLSKAGWQPMHTPDGRYFIVYNGEVYNYRELRQELEKRGVRFRSRTDTEVVLQAYAQWGAEALNQFVGMFAFAVLDTKERKVFLARDFFGIKPLYYTFYHECLVFASEIKALLALPGMKAKVHPQRVYGYLRYGLTDHATETLFQGIYQLLPAHYMVASIDKPRAIQLQRYWDPTPEQRLDISFEEAVCQLRELFLESIGLHLRSDVPLGTALSGGIDSSAIVSAVRHLDPQAEIHTFSFIPAENPAISEERWVDIVGKHVGAQMHKVRPKFEDLLRDLDKLIYVQDEPFGSTSIYAQYRVFRLAHDSGVKVMLDGQGADELLGGYMRYRSARLMSLVKQGRWNAAFRFLHALCQLPGSKTYLLFAGDFLLPPVFYSLARKLVRDELFPSWLNQEWFKRQGVKFETYFRPEYGADVLREELLNTLKVSSLPKLLRYEDRNSMAYSLESRVPFLTPRLVNFILAMPEEYIISEKGTTKYIFREAMRGLVPDSILDRKDKVGFATPEKFWLSSFGNWVEETIMRAQSGTFTPIFDYPNLVKEWHLVRQGRKRFNSRIWRWVNLIRWMELFNVEVP